MVGLTTLFDHAGAARRVWPEISQLCFTALTSRPSTPAPPALRTINRTPGFGDRRREHGAGQFKRAADR